MGQISLRLFLGLAVVCGVLIVSGCITIPNSPIPRFYALTAVDDNQVTHKIKMAPGLLIGIGPVNIPEYQDRPQIVTIDTEKMIHFAQFDRWGESLDIGLARLIREDLTVMLPGTKLTLYPWNFSLMVKYQVVLEVVQLDSELDRDMLFVVQWMVIDVKDNKIKIIKRSVFHQAITPPNYAGLVQSLSTAFVSLSGQIAASMANLK